MVDGRQLTGLVRDPVDLVQRVVDDADVARPALLPGLEEHLPEVLVDAAALGPVDQPQVDEVGAESGQRLVEGLPRGPCDLGGTFMVKKTSSRGTPESASARPTWSSLPS